MILTPKNWKSFQHYKERTPSWIKLHKGLMTDFEFVRLPVASRALAPMLWLLASEYEGGSIDASLEKIAFRMHMSVSDLRDALSPLIDAGFFDASEALSPPLAERLPREEDIGKRTREETENKSRAASPSNDDFEELKRSFPKRKGNYGWKAAERKFNALVKTGVDPKAIIMAARKLCHTLKAKIGTEYIPMPASWLNSEDFTEIAAMSFIEQPEELNWDAVLVAYKKTGHWSRFAGNDPSSPNCRCPPEILAKYGLLQQSETVQ
jgi:hypothetical protein